MIAAELKRLLQSFADCDVRYLLADGFKRPSPSTLNLSQELDFWLKPSHDNARRLIRALKIFGTPMHGVQPEQLATAETQFTLACRPHRLEFYTHIPGLQFDTAFESRDRHRAGSLAIHLLSSRDFAQARASLQRPLDELDPDVED